MKKHFLCSIGKKQFLLGVLLVIINSIVIGQPPLPNMWVDKAKSALWQGNFSLKHYLLSEYPDKVETKSMFYTKDIFKAVIDSFSRISDCGFVRVYIAAYGNDYSSLKVPPQFGDKLTLIYAPVNKKGEDIGQYYSIPPKSTTIDWDKFSISPRIKKSWTDNYLNKKIPKLLSTLSITEKDNYDDYGNFVDTKSIRYPIENLKGLSREIYIQDSIATAEGIDKITGVIAFFASFTKKGNDSNEFKDRLLVQFEFTKQLFDVGKPEPDEIFYIDDAPKFRERLEVHKMQIARQKSKNSSERALGFDHGDLCPPRNCN